MLCLVVFSDVSSIPILSLANRKILHSQKMIILGDDGLAKDRSCTLSFLSSYSYVSRVCSCDGKRHFFCFKIYL